MMIIGMFAGCIAAALWANNVKIRLPQHKIRIWQAVIGGIIAGFGARLAMGCNRQPSLPVSRNSPSMPVLCTGNRRRLLLRRKIYAAADVPHSGQTAKVSKASPLTQDLQRAKRRFRLGMLIFLLCVTGLCSRCLNPRNWAWRCCLASGLVC